MKKYVVEQGQNYIEHLVNTCVESSGEETLIIFYFSDFLDEFLS